MPTEEERRPEQVVRRGVPADAEAVATLLRRVREQNTGSIPPDVHSFAAMLTWVRDTVLLHCDVWVADTGGEIVGVLVLRRPDWLEHLYLDAAATGAGLGSRLVDLAKAELGGQVQLWTFTSNIGAQRFYERHGFVAVERTDGDNDEGQPDIRYVYTPPEPRAAADGQSRMAP